MGKQIIGKFDKQCKNIEFFEVISSYKHYTILRKQCSDKYYVYDNYSKLLSEGKNIPNMSIKKCNNQKLLDGFNLTKWNHNCLFFWADSKFVTEYGLPEYDQLVELYRKLIRVKLSQKEILDRLLILKKCTNWLVYIKCYFMTKKHLKLQDKAIRGMIKEFKLIW